MENNDNLITKGFVVWEEKNLIGPLTNCESKETLEAKGITENTEIKSSKSECEDTGKKKCL